MKNNEKKPFQKMKKAILLKTCSVVLMAATTAILIAMPACKNNPTTPTTPPPLEDTFGKIVGSFNGVDAYSNRNSNYRSNEDNYYNGAITGKKWLCNEYIRRYYLQIYGRFLDDATYGGEASKFYIIARDQGGFLAYDNGGSVAPQVGDIICGSQESGGRSHTAIVREVGPNYVNVIQQNLNNSSLDNSWTLGRNGNHVDPFNVLYVVDGWLRNPGGGNVRRIR